MVKGKLILAESATNHPDGTVSMLRGFITHIHGKKPPYTLQGVLVAHIRAEVGDEGSHKFEVRCMDTDGAKALPPLQATINVPAGGGSSVVVLGLAVQFHKIGDYVFVLRVDNVELDTMLLTVDNNIPTEKNE